MFTESKPCLSELTMAKTKSKYFVGQVADLLSGSHSIKAETDSNKPLTKLFSVDCSAAALKVTSGLECQLLVRKIVVTSELVYVLIYQCYSRFGINSYYWAITSFLSYMSNGYIYLLGCDEGIVK